MNPDLIGPLEARLLALERKQARIDRSLRDARVDLVGLSQGIWDGWSDARGRRVAMPAPPCTGDFPAICACIPTTFTIHNSSYGDCTVTYDSTSGSWKGCFVVAYAGGGVCTACSTAQHYELVGSNATNAWSLIFRFKTHTVGVTQCPVASICSDATNYSVSYNFVTVGCGNNSNNLGNAGPFQPGGTVLTWTW